MAIQPLSQLHTHEVSNQPPVPGDRDLWQDDPLARDLLGDVPLTTDVAAYGRKLGRAHQRDMARAADVHPPELMLFDRGGHRLDEVVFHPAYHHFMQLSAEAGYHAVAWEDRDAGQRAHALMVYLASQVEPGHCCPLTMTCAAQPVLQKAEKVPPFWARLSRARGYDPRVLPAPDKSALMLGMAMTEKQGGSDVRANTTWAVPADGAWRLTGHKWFCSAPMSDGFLTLAQTKAGLTCFLVPRWLETGRNGIRLQRLKSKLGNRANASAEIEYEAAEAYLVGAAGDGVRTILDMVHHTRLDTALAPAGLMRAALREAVHWARHRTAFQKRLIDQPLMQTVLADAALDWAGALALGLDVAAAFDGRKAEDRAYARIAVALAKFLANKLCPAVVGEAMEALGGMGYIEETGLPMLYREAPLNGIWEGSANIICLDVLRSLARQPLSAEILAEKLFSVRGRVRVYDTALDAYEARWQGEIREADARWFVEETATLLTASSLLRAGPPRIAEAYARSRLGADRGRVYGYLPDGVAAPILDAAFPPG